jgi:hypothetical protein
MAINMTNAVCGHFNTTTNIIYNKNYCKYGDIYYKCSLWALIPLSALDLSFLPASADQRCLDPLTAGSLIARSNPMMKKSVYGRFQSSGKKKNIRGCLRIETPTV